MRIGVISDTHNFFDPQIPSLFQGVDHIFHAGDVGLPRILHQLEDIAPVTAVLGNTDDAGFGYRLSELVTLGGRKFLIQHIVHPHEPGDILERRLRADHPDVVVFGHTHKPFCEQIGPTLFFNPGAAGKARFGLPRTVAILHCGQREIQSEYLPL
jgi:hypothetical protein